MEHRDFHLLISREYIDNIGLGRLADDPWNVSKQFTHPARKTHESAVTEVWILGIRKQTQTRRILSLSVGEKANGVNSSQKNFVLILGAFVLRDEASWAIMDYGHCAE